MRDINSLNKVILIGRLGGQPDARVLPQNNRKVVHFTLATNERFYNTNTNEAVNKTEWHRIVVWGKLAEFCEKYLTQGKQIMLEGKIRTRPWQDKDGNKRQTTEIEAENIVLLGRREETAGEGPSAGVSASADFPMDSDDTAHGGEGGDDDIPF
ncbi:MAG: single-stranded DNA-binding protein [Candidatus Aminicenantales bacterium]